MLIANLISNGDEVRFSHHRAAAGRVQTHIGADGATQRSEVPDEIDASLEVVKEVLPNHCPSQVAIPTHAVA